jgi:hypothetical protein
MRSNDFPEPADVVYRATATRGRCVEVRFATLQPAAATGGGCLGAIERRWRRYRSADDRDRGLALEHEGRRRFGPGSSVSASDRELRRRAVADLVVEPARAAIFNKTAPGRADAPSHTVAKAAF